MMELIALWLIGLSAVTFAVYGWDKAQARRGGTRIPERSLHALAIAGGFVGGGIGMAVFRHKTRKAIFKVVLAGSTLAWVAILWWMAG